MEWSDVSNAKGKVIVYEDGESQASLQHFDLQVIESIHRLKNCKNFILIVDNHNDEHKVISSVFAAKENNFRNTMEDLLKFMEIGR